MIRSMVTGGSGFIGSHVVDELIRSGHQVVVLDHRAQPHRPDVEFVDADLTDANAVLSATQGFDYIFHLGAVADLNSVIKDPSYGVRVNVLGSLNVLDAARKNGARRFILASSVWIYSGDPTGHLGESNPFHIPQTAPVYSSSKIAAELLCHDYWRAFGQPFTILRYGTPYGPRMRKPLVMHTFITNALAGEPIVVSGDGSQYRNFIYVEELARAHSMALQDVGVNQTYNLDGLRPVTIGEVAETIARILDRDVSIHHIQGRAGDDPGMEVPIAKARLELGWQPTVDIEKGLRMTIEWYRNNQQLA